MSATRTHLNIMEDHESQNEPRMDQEQDPQEEAGKRQFESFGEAVRSAKDDATSKAKEAAPKMKSAVAEVIYDLTYGSAYGAVFLGAFAAELVPKPIKDEFTKGAKAGRDKARTARDKVRDAMTPKKADEASGEVVIDIEPDPAGA
ncbi:MAG: hypothetical protein ABGZ37_09440 [Akkermansiaceae bacterium]